MTIAVISMIRDAWGGSEALWYEMAKTALAKGYKVVHLAYETPHKHPKIKELEGLGLIQYTRPSSTSASGTLNKFFRLSVNFVRKKINDPFKKLFALQPDVVIYNGTCYSIADETLLLRRLKSRSKRMFTFYIIGHLNNDLIRSIDENQAGKIKEAYSLCKNVFFVSRRNIETAKRQLCSDIPNAEIVTNPVNLTSIEYLPFPEVADTIRFALVGNLVTQHKGQDMVIAALNQWNQKNWVLNIYGDGTDQPYLQHLCAFYGLEKKINFFGSVDNIKDIWKTNHILLMPSHMEGMPLAVVEAMLCGRLCIATNVGGHCEWITHEKNGFVAEAPTVNALLYALTEAWACKNNWQQMGYEAHKTAMERYDPNAGTSLLNRIIAA